MTATTMRASLAEQKSGRWMQARQLWIGFWWWLLMPLDLIDLKTGLPDYDRIAPVALLWIFASKILNEQGWPPTVQVGAWLAAIFGPRMFKQFLVRSQLTGSDTSSTSVVLTKTILEERKSGDGFQPTP